MTGALEGRHALERDGVADVNVRRGRVDPELHAQGPAERELALELALGEDVDRVPGQLCDPAAMAAPIIESTLRRCTAIGLHAAEAYQTPNARLRSAERRCDGAGKRCVRAPTPGVAPNPSRAGHRDRGEDSKKPERDHRQGSRASIDARSNTPTPPLPPIPWTSPIP